jgi:predicted dehydrogenase
VIIPALVRAGARLELVGGGAGPSAEAAGRTLGFARVATDGREVISDADVDAVVICTRHASHADLATQALEAGKHVFCEKPVGLSAAEIGQVCAAAASDGAGILVVGFNRRFSPHLRSLREFVETGKRLLGSYRVSAGQVARDHWVHDLTQGGGRVLGEVCHFIDSLAFVAGSPVVEVHAYGYGQSGLPVQSHDRVAVNLRFESGSVGTVLYVADGSPKVSKERLEVFTASRTAILDDYTTLELYDGGRRSRQRLRAQDKGHAAELAAFVEGVRTGIAPVAIDEIRNVSLATVAVVESLRTGRPLRIDASGR